MSGEVIRLVKSVAKEFDGPFTSRDVLNLIKKKYNYKQYYISTVRIGRILRMLPEFERIGSAPASYRPNPKSVNLWIYRGE